MSPPTLVSAALGTKSKKLLIQESRNRNNNKKINSYNDDMNIAYISGTIIATVVFFFFVKQTVANVQRTKLSEKNETLTLFTQCYVFPWRSIIICQMWDYSFV